MDNIIDSLSPIERKIVPYLNESTSSIIKKSGLDKTSVIRALTYLENKGFVKIKHEEKTIIDLGVNGVQYKKTHLPERKLLILFETRNHIPIEEAKKLSKLSDNEFKVSLGVLKNKSIVEIKNEKISLVASREEVVKKFPEERLLEVLPIEKEKLKDEELLALDNLKKRKAIIEIKEEKIVTFELTASGEKIAGKEIKSDLLEEVTPEIIKNHAKSKGFRKYDVKAFVPQISGGKKHFVNQSIEYTKKIWLELGFKEMTGPLAEISFWNFDALFTAQDHPVRELQDTFYIKDTEGKLPEKNIVEKVKKAHEKGVEKSKGWQYSWDEKEARKVVLRTHTTTLSARTLSKLELKNIPAKFFAVGKCFRNETLDWSHGFEFNQTEGIVVDKNANFVHLLGYLKIFFTKMGFNDVRFVPAYFPYTEPSVEIHIFHPKKKAWLELGGAGIFRPEVVIPLLGEWIPVLAWGPGHDRILTDYYKINDLRELYKNDIKELREKRVLLK